ncbi:hypothetical protein K431DRAFT_338886 [Polychaeton citri CBS 116435]|uniref:Uncharacterized protein n=1 Tax=Polychaeton citri CBS 116435 TaxID=1314669 RepID=A0A9P4Q8L0_9PEZI|nr:hypothetical protein K431DRAFT_338886 [Polychaeton citri CBS 116435]
MPVRSRYFAKQGKEIPKDDPSDSKEDEVSLAESGSGDESDFDDDGSSESSDSHNEEGNGRDDYESEELRKPSRKPTTGKREKSIVATQSKGNELWRHGVSAGLGPGTQVVIKKPKARPAGNTPYVDETIHPNTLLFLGELKENNDRQWLKMHDPDFRQAEKDWFSFVEKLTERLVEVDDTVPELPVKDIIFRIYRDVRFSSDPTPYKPHFSAAWSRTGRKGPYAHYYVQVSPGNESFVGGGLWHPEAAPTAAMRRDIDRNSQRLKTVLLEQRMRDEFLNGCSKDTAKAVKAFVNANAANALKTKPKGYDADHADIELLRLRNFTVGTKLDESKILDENVMNHMAELFSSMKPFISYLNSVVMPDEAESSSSDDETNVSNSADEESAGEDG